IEPGLSSIRSLVIAQPSVLYAFVKKSTASAHVAAYLNAALLPTLASVQAVSVVDWGMGMVTPKQSLIALLSVNLLSSLLPQAVRVTTKSNVSILGMALFSSCFIAIDF